jgi:hypothetical protein
VPYREHWLKGYIYIRLHSGNASFDFCPGKPATFIEFHPSYYLNYARPLPSRFLQINHLPIIPPKYKTVKKTQNTVLARITQRLQSLIIRGHNTYFCSPCVLKGDLEFVGVVGHSFSGKSDNSRRV